MGVRSAAVALILVAFGCGSGEPVESAAPSETYGSPRDGLSVEYPQGWHLAEEPLAGAQTGAAVELVGLATIPPAEPVEGWSPYPWSTMKALGPGDVVMTLRADLGTWVDEGVPKPGPRPGDVLGSALPASDLPGGCAVGGVEQWTARFVEHDRVYEIFVAARGRVSENRRSQIEDVWASLRLSDLAEPRGDAVVGEPYWHVLLTHCGIEGTSFDGRDWVAEPVLGDGMGNPPPGWGNPFEPGFMTLTAEDRAVFTSRSGDRSASFRLRNADDAAIPPCA